MNVVLLRNHYVDLYVMSYWNVRMRDEKNRVLTPCPNIANCVTQVKSMDDNCGEWVEFMRVASGCGEQEVGVTSGRGWNLWVWL